MACWVIGGISDALGGHIGPRICIFFCATPFSLGVIFWASIAAVFLRGYNTPNSFQYVASITRRSDSCRLAIVNIRSR